MGNQFYKALSLILLLAFLSHYFDLFFWINIEGDNSNQRHALCNCDAQLCCCLAEANTIDDSVCVVKRQKESHSEEPAVPDMLNKPAFVKCDLDSNISIISGCKQILKNSTQAVICFFPNLFEVEFDLTSFRLIDFKPSVFHPPRA